MCYNPDSLDGIFLFSRCQARPKDSQGFVNNEVRLGGIYAEVPVDFTTDLGTCNKRGTQEGTGEDNFGHHRSIAPRGIET
jgi:hypothetical protein